MHKTDIASAFLLLTGCVQQPSTAINAKLDCGNGLSEKFGCIARVNLLKLLSLISVVLSDMSMSVAESDLSNELAAV